MQYYVDFWKNFANFDGRSSRQAFWMFVLINLGIAIPLNILDGIISAAAKTNLPIFGGLYALATFIPGIALWIRRLHDIGRSGWSLLFAFIPCAGIIIMIVFAATEGQRGTNDYGPDPYGGGGKRRRRDEDEDDEDDDRDDDDDDDDRPRRRPSDGIQRKGRR